MSGGNRIKVRADGPLLCTGDVSVHGADGALLAHADDLVLCRCGHSANKPFCDGSHRASEFIHDGCFTDPKGEPLQADAPLAINVRENAMLIASGPVTIVCADGSCQTTRNRAALCRCGRSANKPFCDASHRQCGFKG
jgi:CDGSH-type Zn-finger protein